MSDLKKKILEAVKDDLVRVEQALADHLHPHFELVEQVAGHLLFAGGKRLRPLLMMHAARLCGGHKTDLAQVAVIFEYLHAATLMHDDVVDGARLRRGRPAAHHVWDPPTAVLIGDFLLARSLSLAARTGLPEVIEVIAGITEQMSQGEIRQLAYKGDVSLSEEIYLDVIRCKTAVLFQGACRTGALIAAADPKQADAMDAYGFHLGMAFQMADDLLDYTQSTADLGKAAGADLREGKLTLPVIRTLSRSEASDRAWIEALLRNPEFSTTEFERLIALMREYDGIDYTRQRAAAHIGKAKEALSGFQAGGHLEVLQDIAEYALSRSS